MEKPRFRIDQYAYNGEIDTFLVPVNQSAINIWVENKGKNPFFHPCLGPMSKLDYENRAKNIIGITFDKYAI